MILLEKNCFCDSNFIPNRPNLPLECSMCSLAEREDVIYFIERCPILKEIRREIFEYNCLLEEQVILMLNEIYLAKLYEHCEIALRYRSQILKEEFWIDMCWTYIYVITVYRFPYDFFLFYIILYSIIAVYH